MSDEIAQMKEMLDNLGADRYPEVVFQHVGKRVARRLDGQAKASGRAEYTMDVRLPGMLYMRLFDSPYPQAKILRMDTSQAETLPGVRGVLRYDDPELPPMVDLAGHVPAAETVLPGIAYFQGQPCGAAVCAESEAIAEEALRRIEIEWEVRPFVLDAEEALKAEAPLANPEVFPWGNHYNEVLLGPAFTEIKQGDVTQGFAEADKIIEFRSLRRLHTWALRSDPVGFSAGKETAWRSGSNSKGPTWSNGSYPPGSEGFPRTRSASIVFTRGPVSGVGAKSIGIWDPCIAPRSWPNAREGRSNGFLTAGKIFSAARWTRGPTT